ncbi:hypothetical protein MCHI_003700 [Candidatus Magnetoovum chiemensis]|nr:hypothetical protein MCHI_003700 [Candidatus Magnetoovum chiemensis]
MANEYDRIIKETLRDVIDVLMEEVLGIKADKITPLETKMQITMEREVDFLYKIEEKEETYISHFEFQTTNDNEMLDRMHVYRAVIRKTHKMEVRQCLFYIGKEPLRMDNVITERYLTFEYEIIDFKRLDCSKFIKSNNPKLIVISILCDYKNKDPRLYIREILQRIKDTVKEETLRSKYITQI